MSVTQKKILAENIIRFMGDRSQSEIARNAQMGLRLFWGYCHPESKANPTLENLEKIAKALSTPLAKVEPWQLLKKQD
ncbi:MAG TPA: hypothetical protein VHE12_05705 [bacterium]|nr:hypothetical protein [bacterium]